MITQLALELQRRPSQSDRAQKPNLCGRNVSFQVPRCGHKAGTPCAAMVSLHKLDMFESSGNSGCAECSSDTKLPQGTCMYGCVRCTWVVCDVCIVIKRSAETELKKKDAQLYRKGDDVFVNVSEEGGASEWRPGKVMHVHGFAHTGKYNIQGRDRTFYALIPVHRIRKEAPSIPEARKSFEVRRRDKILEIKTHGLSQRHPEIAGRPAMRITGAGDTDVKEPDAPRGCCPAQHKLSCFTTDGPYRCDRCAYRIGEGLVMYGCRQCNFDMCESCYSC